MGGKGVDLPIGVFSAGAPYMKYNSVTGLLEGVAIVPGTGDFVGPGASVDNHLVLFNSTSGKLGKDSAPIVVDAAGNMTGVGTITSGNVNGVAIAAHAARHLPGGADTVFAGTWAADDVPQWNGTLWVPKLRKALAVASDYTGASITLGDITGLTVNLPRAGTYWCEFSLATSLATTAQLIAAGINVSANFTRCAIQVDNYATATAPTAGCQVANNTATASVSRTTLATNLPILLSGTVTVSGAATLACRIQRAANVLTVVAGSGGFVMEL